MYNATLADLDHGERIRVQCACGHEAVLLVTFLVEKRKIAIDTRLLDLANKVRCRGCGRRGDRRRID